MSALEKEAKPVQALQTRKKKFIEFVSPVIL